MDLDLQTGAFLLLIAALVAMLTRRLRLPYSAGLIMGNFKSLGTISGHGKETVQAFWEYAAFVANSFVFLLIGMHEAHQHFLAIWLPALIAIALVTFGRAVAIYPCCLLFSRSRLRISTPHQHVLFWGGLRGALALALGLPSDVPKARGDPRHQLRGGAFSVFVQGLTMTAFLRKMGEIPR